MLNATALVLPPSAALLPITVSVAMLGKSSKSTSLAFIVTHPSVTVKSSLSKLAKPFNACFSCAVPAGFGAVPVAVASCILSLL